MTEQELLLAATFVDNYLDEEDESKILEELHLLQDPDLKESGILLNYVRNQGIEQGIEYGDFQRALQTAEKMRMEGFDWQVITRILSISELDLQNWIKNDRKIVR